MRTLHINHDGVCIMDHRGYTETEIFQGINQHDVFELHKGNRGFSVRWLMESESCGPVTNAWFQRINVIENYSNARIVEVKE